MTPRRAPPPAGAATARRRRVCASERRPTPGIRAVAAADRWGAPSGAGAARTRVAVGGRVPRPDAP
jgi:hypothetical protein